MDNLRLLDEDCDDSTDETVLETVKKRNVKKLCTLINSGADVNGRDVLNKTTVMCAVERGSYRCLHVLIKAGADLNAVDDENNTALILAVDCNALRCVELLVNGGADVNKLNIYGRTALARAAELVQKGCIDVLIKAGASVNMKLDDGETILSCAIVKNKKIGFSDPYERLIVRPQCLELLLEAGADVNKPSRGGVTPLMHAISRYSIIQCGDLVGPLLHYGADVNAVNKEGATPLIVLASMVNRKGSYISYDDDGKIYRVQLLLKSGAHLKRTLSGFNALEHHIAFSKNVNKRLSMLLLAAGETTRQRFKCMKGGKAVHIIPPKYFTQPEPKDFRLKSMCRRMIRKHLLQMSPMNLICRVPLLRLTTELSKYLLYNVSLDAEVEKWARRRDTDDNDDEYDPKINFLRSCTHNKHAYFAAVNKVKSLWSVVTAALADFSSSNSSSIDMHALMRVASNNSNSCYSSIESSSSSGNNSSSSRNNSSSNSCESDDENNVAAKADASSGVNHSVDRSKRKRNKSSPVATRRNKRRFVGRFPVNGEDYSALDVDFDSSDDDAGVLREKLPTAYNDDENNNAMDIKDERGSDVDGKFSSDDGEDRMEGEFSDEGDSGGGSGIADHTKDKGGENIPR